MNKYIILSLSLVLVKSKERLEVRLEKIRDDVFVLRGKIKEITDYEDVKNLLQKADLANQKEFIFIIPHAKDITFYLLGYWLKIVQYDGFKLTIVIANKILYGQFLRLGLHCVFEVVHDEMERYLQSL